MSFPITLSLRFVLGKELTEIYHLKLFPSDLKSTLESLSSLFWFGFTAAILVVLVLFGAVRSSSQICPMLDKRLFIGLWLREIFL